MKSASCLSSRSYAESFYKLLDTWVVFRAAVLALCRSLMCLSVTEGAEVIDAEADWRTAGQLDGPMVVLCCRHLRSGL